VETDIAELPLLGLGLRKGNHTLRNVYAIH
jgi:hypothetical protein